MKKNALVILVLIAVVTSSIAQEQQEQKQQEQQLRRRLRQEVCVPWGKTRMPIYANQLCDSIIDTLYQDYELEDHLFEVFVIEKSPLRFKIQYGDLYDDTDSTKIGWIDKKYCGVYDRGYYDVHGQYYIKLYEAPDQNSSFIQIYDEPLRALTVVDFDGIFYKVIFEINDVVYIGWVDKLCPNGFNNCT